MRARNIKPATFQNELLGTSDALYTVIFAGLWCLADREGRLEDRPGKIHMQINAGRPIESTMLALDWLTEHAFVHRYEVDGVRYIFVLEFEKHQHPHVREPASVIPKPPKYSKLKKLNGSASPGPMEAPARPGAEHRPFALIPDSGSLDSGSLDPPLLAPGASEEDLQLKLSAKHSPPSGAKSADDESVESKRGSRIPNPFLVASPDWFWAQEKFPQADLSSITEEFFDYWKSVPGTKGRKLDWMATWRNRVRERADRVLKPKRRAKTVAELEAEENAKH